MVLNEQQTSIPQPRLVYEYDREESGRPSLRFAASQLCDELVVFGNISVYALAGNGEMEDVQERIRSVKGDGRGMHQPVGLTIPFERFLPYVDASQIEQGHVRKLIENPDELTGRIGALLFVRVAARKLIGGFVVPRCVLSNDGDGATIQNYSPVGNLHVSAFLHYSEMEGVEFPVMTSANKSGEPEIVSTHEARVFAGEADLPFVPYPAGAEGSARLRGSYPVVDIAHDSIRIVREGFLGRGIIEALFDGYPVVRAADAKPSSYPAQVLRFKDLPSWARTARASELRAVILAYMSGKLRQD